MTPLEEIRHSAAHVLATAMLRLHPDAKLDIGPPTAAGFYYDFDLEHTLSVEDLGRLEQTMEAIIRENQTFERVEVSRDEAQRVFSDRKQPYKLERLADIPEGEVITLYKNGEFVDLCAGTHVRSTRAIGAVKLLSIAGAYYRGSEKNKQMQRIYGTAFATKAELDAHLNQLEQAKLRDHRKLGKELELFHIDESVGSGLVLWTPKGAIIRQALQDFISEELRRQGYSIVFTPHIGKLGLFKTSGHFPYYQDSQFPAIIERDMLEVMVKENCSCAELASRMQAGDVDGYLLKPMNCPMHIKIFDSQPRSYRELPIRLAEFGTVYRWEQSGELNGLTRVRGLTQDDAHIFCTHDQVLGEVRQCLELVKLILNTLHMTDYRVRLSMRDPSSDKYVGSNETWDKAEGALRTAIETVGLPYFEGIGEAAFYGPKIDFMVRDVIGREWQLGTIQLDYQLPERFDLKYTGSDNLQHRPVMIHRAPFGSIERFCGVLIEHFGGNFPTWLAPEQVRVLPLNDDLVSYADTVASALKAVGIRVSVDGASEKLGAKIRKAETAKVPYMFVVGEKEKAAGAVSVRSRAHKEFDGTRTLEEALAHMQQVVRDKA